MQEHTFCVNPTTGSVDEVDEATFLVTVDEFGPMPTTEELLNAGDNPGMSVTPLFEQLRYEGEEDYPTIDLVERAGFDGTLRGLDGRPVGELVSWKELALRAMGA